LAARPGPRFTRVRSATSIARLSRPQAARRFESRCTSSPATRSRIRLIATPWSRPDDTAAGGGPGGRKTLGSVLEATLPDPYGPAPDLAQARSTKRRRRPRPDSHHQHFIPPTMTARSSRLSHDLAAVRAAPAGSLALGQLRSLSGDPADVPRWRHWVLGVDAIGRITLPPEARAVAAGRRTVRAASHESALVLRANGLGAATHLDRRGRLALPTWLRRLVRATGMVLVAARFPDASLVVVTPTSVLDAVIDGVAGSFSCVGPLTLRHLEPALGSELGRRRQADQVATRRGDAAARRWVVRHCGCRARPVRPFRRRAIARP
jgi:hypothetical protein